MGDDCATEPIDANVAARAGDVDDIAQLSGEHVDVVRGGVGDISRVRLPIAGLEHLIVAFEMDRDAVLPGARLVGVGDELIRPGGGQRVPRVLADQSLRSVAGIERAALGVDDCEHQQLPVLAVG